MDFDFTQEQDMLRDGIARLIRDQYDFDSRRKAIASGGGWRPELWAQFAEMGLMMAPFSEEDGGLGGGPIDAMIVLEEFGRGLVVEPYIPTVVSAGGFLKHAGSAAQKEAFLSGIIGGEMVMAWAHSEPKSRYDLAHVETSAKASGGGYVLNGHKSVVIGAPWASHLVVTARTSGAARDRGGLSVFIVDKAAKGVTCRDYRTVDGQRASDISFENVAVGADALIGPADGALGLIERVADETIAALCAEACGAMKSAHAMTVDYARQRKQFGVAIGSFQVLQHRMVDMFMEYEQSVSMTYMLNLKLDEPATERRKAAAAAKAQIGKSGKFIGQSAVQIHGGMGMTEELAVGHYFKRLTMIDATLGNTDHHIRAYARLSAGDLIAAE